MEVFVLDFKFLIFRIFLYLTIYYIFIKNKEKNKNGTHTDTLLLIITQKNKQLSGLTKNFCVIQNYYV